MANTVNSSYTIMVRSPEQVGWLLPDGSLVSLSDPWPSHHDPETWLPVYVDGAYREFLEKFRSRQERKGR